MEKKIFVIQIEEAADMCDYPHPPFAYDTMEKAKNKIKELYETALSQYEETFRNRFDDDSTETCVSLYESNRYIENHYSATIYEVEVN